MLLIEALCLLSGVKYARLAIHCNPQPGRVKQTEAYSILVEQRHHFIEGSSLLGEVGTEVLKNPDGISLVRDVPVFPRPLQHMLLLGIFVEADDDGT